MKINKKAIAIITIVFLILFNYFRPTIVIHGAPNKTLLIKTLMDFHDKYYDGDVSIWYVDMEGLIPVQLASIRGVSCMKMSMLMILFFVWEGSC